MTKRVSATQAKARLSELAAEVAHGGEQIIIERRGRPWAALVSVEDLSLLEQSRAASDRPQGALALAGAWRDVADDQLESVIASIYAERVADTGRTVDIGD